MLPLKNATPCRDSTELAPLRQGFGGQVGEQTEVRAARPRAKGTSLMSANPIFSGLMTMLSDFDFCCADFEFDQDNDNKSYHAALPEILDLLD